MFSGLMRTGFMDVGGVSFFFLAGILVSGAGKVVLTQVMT